MRDREKQEMDQGGFTLIELLVAIVVVGILTAVAIVGIGGLTDTAKTATCQTTLDSARAATASFYTRNASTYPTTIADMTTVDNPPDLVLQGGVVPGTNTISSDSGTTPKWQITLGTGGQWSVTGPDSSNCL